MDIRNSKWHGQLAVSGVGQPKNHQGSILTIIGEMLKDLQSLQPRELASGEREITIRFKTSPFTSSKQTQDLDRLVEITSELDETGAIHGPRINESHQEFVERLVELGMSSPAALMIAAAWFPNHEPPEDLVNWLSDPQAVRFRMLNSSRESFEQAAPMEYEQLKHYVIHAYPQFASDMTFRTA